MDTNEVIDKHNKVVELLQTVCDSIAKLAEYDEFIYNIFYHTFQYDLKLVEALTTGKKVDPDEALLFLSRIMNVDIKTIVERSIAQLNAEKRLKAGIGNLSDQQKELAERISSMNSPIEDFKNYDFNRFLCDIELGTLDGNE